MIYYVIPARRNSVGVPFKNRALLRYTLATIPECEYGDTIITTDDEFIISEVEGKGIQVIERSPELSSSSSSVKDVMIDVIEKCGLKQDDIIVMLYLTSPTRTQEDISDVLDFYKEKGAKSLLCGYDVLSHPYLAVCMENDCQGKVIVEHDMCRRQEYPPCLVLCHFICIFHVSEVHSLSSNLYNESTYYYHIDKPIDIDTEEDLEKLEIYLNK